jgi:hypothetical protein
MRTTHKLRLLGSALLLASCSDPNGPQFALDVSFADPAAPGDFRNDVTLRYAAGGTFFVRVQANANSAANINIQSAPLHANLQITNEAVVPGATYSATPLLLPGEKSYSGIASLVWPPGGKIDVNVAASGHVTQTSVTMDPPSPKSALALTIKSPTTPAFVAPAAVVPIAVDATYAMEASESKPAAGVTVTFEASSSASVEVSVVPGSTLVVPTNATTDEEGHAEAALIMPSLGTGGVLYMVAVAAGAVSPAIELRNGPPQ